MTNQDKLKVIRNEVGESCTRCTLCSTRKQIVFGSGSSTASIMFIAMGPGRIEDETGEPLIGPAGQVFTKMIAAAGLSRSSVYMSNIVMCKLPDDRPPTDLEIAACTPFLNQKIEAIHPKVIVAMGGVAANYLTGQTKLGITRLREHNPFVYQGDGFNIPLIVTLHPSYVMRSQGSNKEEHIKWDAWNDLQRAISISNG